VRTTSVSAKPTNSQSRGRDLINAPPDLDPAEFVRASHDEAWGCAYSRLWRAYHEVIRQAG